MRKMPKTNHGMSLKKRNLTSSLPFAIKRKKPVPFFLANRPLPIGAFWIPRKATGTDAEKFRKFRETAQSIQRRIELLCSFPIEKLGHLLTQPAGENELNKIN